MFTSTGNYMCTFLGRNLCVCGLDASAGWQSVDYLSGGIPQAMQGFEGPSVIVLDNRNHLWICGIPRGSFRPIPESAQPPSELQIREFMGAGLGTDNRTWFLAAVDTQNRGWLVGNPTGGGNWVPLPRLNPPHRAREGKKGSKSRKAPESGEKADTNASAENEIKEGESSAQNQIGRAATNYIGGSSGGITSGGFYLPNNSDNLVIFTAIRRASIAAREQGSTHCHKSFLTDRHHVVVKFQRAARLRESRSLRRAEAAALIPSAGINLLADLNLSV